MMNNIAAGMKMRTFIDQLGRHIAIPFPPRRVISLVPSQTELLFDLGLNQRIVGITKFCVHPENLVNSVDKIGGTKKLDLQKIRSLKPDLIIGNKEENERNQIEILMKEFPVWMSDIETFDEALEMIGLVGLVTDTETEAAKLAVEIHSEFMKLEHQKADGLRVAYFIWRKPFMLAGKGTFIDNMLNRAGFSNISLQHRYPEITASGLQKAAPELVFLSSEPYPFKDRHIEEMKKILPTARVLLVDGEMFSWYGSRLIKTPRYLTELIGSLRNNN